MGAREQSMDGRLSRRSPCPHATVRYHPARPPARPLRRRCAPDRARVQHREREHARLQAEGRGLPQRAAGRLRERRREGRRQRLLRRDDADRRHAPGRQRRRRRRRVGQDGPERAGVPGPRAGRPRPHRDPPVGDREPLMSLFGSLDISASALSAERLRMDVTAENLANAQSTRDANGQPYRRKEVVLQEASANGGFGGALQTAPGRGTRSSARAGVQVAGIVQDTTPGRRMYDPTNPDANAQGYVTMPNVNPVTEMVDLIDASRAYEANVTAMQSAKQMFTKTLDLLR